MRPGRLALAELAVLLLVLTVAHLAAGEAQSGAGPTRLRSACRDCVRPPAARCPDAQKAIGHYRRQYTQARTRMGLEGAPPREWYPCPAARERAVTWRNKAAAARRALGAWTHYQYAWWDWMPRGWQNIGACETGYGRRPGNFQHNSGTYQGAFGFAVSSWDGFVSSADPKAGPYPSEAYLATPRQQYEVALAIWRRYGLSGWGCRGAFYGG